VRRDSHRLWYRFRGQVNGTGFLTRPGVALLRSLEALGDERLEHYRAVVASVR